MIHLYLGGLLNNVVSAVKCKALEDVYIVPVSISYDKIPDGTFAEEKAGKCKKPETIWSFFKAVKNFLCGYYGHIRIHFGQPFSLKVSKLNLFKLGMKPWS